MKYFIGAIALMFMLSFGGHLAVYVISGCIMFVGMVLICETTPIIKKLFKFTAGIVDLVLFGFGIYALSAMGPTVSIGLSVCGILFTVFYKPLLRKKTVKRSTE